MHILLYSYLLALLFISNDSQEHTQTNAGGFYTRLKTRIYPSSTISSQHDLIRSTRTYAMHESQIESLSTRLIDKTQVRDTSTRVVNRIAPTSTIGGIHNTVVYSPTGLTPNRVMSQNHQPNTVNYQFTTTDDPSLLSYQLIPTNNTGRISDYNRVNSQYVSRKMAHLQRHNPYTRALTEGPEWVHYELEEKTYTRRVKRDVINSFYGPNDINVPIVYSDVADLISATVLFSECTVHSRNNTLIGFTYGNYSVAPRDIVCYEGGVTPWVDATCTTVDDCSIPYDYHFPDGLITVPSVYIHATRILFTAGTFNVRTITGGWQSISARVTGLRPYQTHTSFVNCQYVWRENRYVSEPGSTSLCNFDGYTNNPHEPYTTVYEYSDTPDNYSININGGPSIIDHTYASGYTERILRASGSTSFIPGNEVRYGSGTLFMAYPVYVWIHEYGYGDTWCCYPIMGNFTTYPFHRCSPFKVQGEFHFIGKAFCEGPLSLRVNQPAVVKHMWNGLSITENHVVEGEIHDIPLPEEIFILVGLGLSGVFAAFLTILFCCSPGCFKLASIGTTLWVVVVAVIFSYITPSVLGADVMACSSAGVPMELKVNKGEGKWAALENVPMYQGVCYFFNIGQVNYVMRISSWAEVGYTMASCLPKTGTVTLDTCAEWSCRYAPSKVFCNDSYHTTTGSSYHSYQGICDTYGCNCYDFWSTATCDHPGWRHATGGRQKRLKGEPYLYWRFGWRMLGTGRASDYEYLLKPTSSMIETYNIQIWRDGIIKSNKTLIDPDLTDYRFESEGTNITLQVYDVKYFEYCGYNTFKKAFCEDCFTHNVMRAPIRSMDEIATSQLIDNIAVSLVDTKNPGSGCNSDMGHAARLDATYVYYNNSDEGIRRMEHCSVKPGSTGKMDVRYTTNSVDQGSAIGTGIMVMKRGFGRVKIESTGEPMDLGVPGCYIRSVHTDAISGHFDWGDITHTMLYSVNSAPCSLRIHSTCHVGTPSVYVPTAEYAVNTTLACPFMKTGSASNTFTFIGFNTYKLDVTGIFLQTHWDKSGDRRTQTITGAMSLAGDKGHGTLSWLWGFDFASMADGLISGLTFTLHKLFVLIIGGIVIGITIAFLPGRFKLIAILPLAVVAALFFTGVSAHTHVTIGVYNTDLNKEVYYGTVNPNWVDTNYANRSVVTFDGDFLTTVFGIVPTMSHIEMVLTLYTGQLNTTIKPIHGEIGYDYYDCYLDMNVTGPATTTMFDVLTTVGYYDLALNILLIGSCNNIGGLIFVYTGIIRLVGYDDELNHPLIWIVVNLVILVLVHAGLDDMIYKIVRYWRASHYPVSRKRNLMQVIYYRNSHSAVLKAPRITDTLYSSVVKNGIGSILKNLFLFIITIDKTVSGKSKKMIDESYLSNVYYFLLEGIANLGPIAICLTTWASLFVTSGLSFLSPVLCYTLSLLLISYLGRYSMWYVFFYYLPIVVSHIVPILVGRVRVLYMRWRLIKFDFSIRLGGGATNPLEGRTDYSTVIVPEGLQHLVPNQVRALYNGGWHMITYVGPHYSTSINYTVNTIAGVDCFYLNESPCPMLITLKPLYGCSMQVRFGKDTYHFALLDQGINTIIEEGKTYCFNHQVTPWGEGFYVGDAEFGAPLPSAVTAPPSLSGNINYVYEDGTTGSFYIDDGTVYCANHQAPYVIYVNGSPRTRTSVGYFSYYGVMNHTFCPPRGPTNSRIGDSGSKASYHGPEGDLDFIVDCASDGHYTYNDQVYSGEANDAHVKCTFEADVGIDVPWRSEEDVPTEKTSTGQKTKGKRSSDSKKDKDKDSDPLSVYKLYPCKEHQYCRRALPRGIRGGEVVLNDTFNTRSYRFPGSSITGCHFGYRLGDNQYLIGGKGSTGFAVTKDDFERCNRWYDCGPIDEDPVPEDQGHDEGAESDYDSSSSLVYEDMEEYTFEVDATASPGVRKPRKGPDFLKEIAERESISKNEAARRNIESEDPRVRRASKIRVKSIERKKSRSKSRDKVKPEDEKDQDKWTPPDQPKVTPRSNSKSPERGAKPKTRGRVPRTIHQLKQDAKKQGTPLVEYAKERSKSRDKRERDIAERVLLDAGNKEIKREKALKKMGITGGGGQETNTAMYDRLSKEYPSKKSALINTLHPVPDKTGIDKLVELTGTTDIEGLPDLLAKHLGKRKPIEGQQSLHKGDISDEVRAAIRQATTSLSKTVPVKGRNLYGEYRKNLKGAVPPELEGKTLTSAPDYIAKYLSASRTVEKGDPEVSYDDLSQESKTTLNMLVNKQMTEALKKTGIGLMYVGDNERASRKAASLRGQRKVNMTAKKEIAHWLDASSSSSAQDRDTSITQRFNSSDDLAKTMRTLLKDDRNLNCSILDLGYGNGALSKFLPGVTGVELYPHLSNKKDWVIKHDLRTPFNRGHEISISNPPFCLNKGPQTWKFFVKAAVENSCTSYFVFKDGLGGDIHPVCREFQKYGWITSLKWRGTFSFREPGMSRPYFIKACIIRADDIKNRIDTNVIPVKTGYTKDCTVIKHDGPVRCKAVYGDYDIKHGYCGHNLRGFVSTYVTKKWLIYEPIVNVLSRCQTCDLIGQYEYATGCRTGLYHGECHRILKQNTDIKMTIIMGTRHVTSVGTASPVINMYDGPEGQAKSIKLSDDTELAKLQIQKEACSAYGIDIYSMDVFEEDDYVPWTGTGNVQCASMTDGDVLTVGSIMHPTCSEINVELPYTHMDYISQNNHPPEQCLDAHITISLLGVPYAACKCITLGVRGVVMKTYKSQQEYIDSINWRGLDPKEVISIYNKIDEKIFGSGPCSIYGETIEGDFVLFQYGLASRSHEDYLPNTALVRFTSRQREKLPSEVPFTGEPLKPGINYYIEPAEQEQAFKLAKDFPHICSMHLNGTDPRWNMESTYTAVTHLNAIIKSKTFVPCSRSMSDWDTASKLYTYPLTTDGILSYPLTTEGMFCLATQCYRYGLIPETPLVYHPSFFHLTDGGAVGVSVGDASVGLISMLWTNTLGMSRATEPASRNLILESTGSVGYLCNNTLMVPGHIQAPDTISFRCEQGVRVMNIQTRNFLFDVDTYTDKFSSTPDYINPVPGQTYMMIVPDEGALRKVSMLFQHNKFKAINTSMSAAYGKSGSPILDSQNRLCGFYNIQHGVDQVGPVGSGTSFSLLAMEHHLARTPIVHIELPTGSGKSTKFVHEIALLKKRTLLMVPTTTIADLLYEWHAANSGGLTIEKRAAGQTASTHRQGGKTLTIATSGTFLRKQNLENFDCIILDEVHVKDVHPHHGAAHYLLTHYQHKGQIFFVTATGKLPMLAQYIKSGNWDVINGNDYVYKGVGISARKVHEILGQILILLPGKSNVSDCAAALRGKPNRTVHVWTSEHPLRISDLGENDIIVCTTVAETGVTIKGIETTIDFGYRVRYVGSQDGTMDDYTVHKFNGQEKVQFAGRGGRFTFNSTSYSPFQCEPLPSDVIVGNAQVAGSELLAYNNDEILSTDEHDTTCPCHWVRFLQAHKEKDFISSLVALHNNAVILSHNVCISTKYIDMDKTHYLRDFHGEMEFEPKYGANQTDGLVVVGCIMAFVAGTLAYMSSKVPVTYSRFFDAGVQGFVKISSTFGNWSLSKAPKVVRVVEDGSVFALKITGLMARSGITFENSRSPEVAIGVYSKEAISGFEKRGIRVISRIYECDEYINETGIITSVRCFMEVDSAGLFNDIPNSLTNILTTVISSVGGEDTKMAVLLCTTILSAFFPAANMKDAAVTGALGSLIACKVSDQKGMCVIPVVSSIAGFLLSGSVPNMSADIRIPGISTLSDITEPACLSGFVLTGALSDDPNFLGMGVASSMLLWKMKTAPMSGTLGIGLLLALIHYTWLGIAEAGRGNLELGKQVKVIPAWNDLKKDTNFRTNFSKNLAILGTANALMKPSHLVGLIVLAIMYKCYGGPDLQKFLGANAAGNVATDMLAVFRLTLAKSDGDAAYKDLLPQHTSLPPAHCTGFTEDMQGGYKQVISFIKSGNWDGVAIWFQTLGNSIGDVANDSWAWIRNEWDSQIGTNGNPGRSIPDTMSDLLPAMEDKPPSMPWAVGAASAIATTVVGAISYTLFSKTKDDYTLRKTKRGWRVGVHEFLATTIETKYVNYTHVVNFGKYDLHEDGVVIEYLMSSSPIPDDSVESAVEKWKGATHPEGGSVLPTSYTIQTISRALVHGLTDTSCVIAKYEDWNHTTWSVPSMGARYTGHIRDVVASLHIRPDYSCKYFQDKIKVRSTIGFRGSAWCVMAAAYSGKTFQMVDRRDRDVVDIGLGTTFINFWNDWCTIGGIRTTPMVRIPLLNKKKCVDCQSIAENSDYIVGTEVSIPLMGIDSSACSKHLYTEEQKEIIRLDNSYCVDNYNDEDGNKPTTNNYKWFISLHEQEGWTKRSMSDTFINNMIKSNSSKGQAIAWDSLVGSEVDSQYSNTPTVFKSILASREKERNVHKSVGFDLSYPPYEESDDGSDSMVIPSTALRSIVADCDSIGSFVPLIQYQFFAAIQDSCTPLSEYSRIFEHDETLYYADLGNRDGDNWQKVAYFINKDGIDEHGGTDRIIAVVLEPLKNVHITENVFDYAGPFAVDEGHRLSVRNNLMRWWLRGELPEPTSRTLYNDIRSNVFRYSFGCQQADQSKAGWVSFVNATFEVDLETSSLDPWLYANQRAVQYYYEVPVTAVSQNHMGPTSPGAISIKGHNGCYYTGAAGAISLNKTGGGNYTKFRWQSAFAPKLSVGGSGRTTAVTTERGNRAISERNAFVKCIEEMPNYRDYAYYNTVQYRKGSKPSKGYAKIRGLLEKHKICPKSGTWALTVAEGAGGFAAYLIEQGVSCTIVTRKHGEFPAIAELNNSVAIGRKICRGVSYEIVLGDINEHVPKRKYSLVTCDGGESFYSGNATKIDQESRIMESIMASLDYMMVKGDLYNKNCRLIFKVRYLSAFNNAIDNITKRYSTWELDCAPGKKLASPEIYFVGIKFGRGKSAHQEIVMKQADIAKEAYTVLTTKNAQPLVVEVIDDDTPPPIKIDDETLRYEDYDTGTIYDFPTGYRKNIEYAAEQLDDFKYSSHSWLRNLKTIGTFKTGLRSGFGAIHLTYVVSGMLRAVCGLVPWNSIMGVTKNFYGSVQKRISTKVDRIPPTYSLSQRKIRQSGYKRTVQLVPRIKHSFTEAEVITRANPHGSMGLEKSPFPNIKAALMNPTWMKEVQKCLKAGWWPSVVTMMGKIESKEKKCAMDGIIGEGQRSPEQTGRVIAYNPAKARAAEDFVHGPYDHEMIGLGKLVFSAPCLSHAHIQGITGMFSDKGCAAAEGDGSSWDTTHSCDDTLNHAIAMMKKVQPEHVKAFMYSMGCMGKHIWTGANVCFECEEQISGHKLTKSLNSHRNAAAHFCAMEAVFGYKIDPKDWEPLRRVLNVDYKPFEYQEHLVKHWKTFRTWLDKYYILPLVAGDDVILFGDLANVTKYCELSKTFLYKTFNIELRYGNHGGYGIHKDARDCSFLSHKAVEVKVAGKRRWMPDRSSQTVLGKLMYVKTNEMTNIHSPDTECKVRSKVTSALLTYPHRPLIRMQCNGALAILGDGQIDIKETHKWGLGSTPFKCSDTAAAFKSYYGVPLEDFGITPVEDVRDWEDMDLNRLIMSNRAKVHGMNMLYSQVARSIKNYVNMIGVKDWRPIRADVKLRKEFGIKCKVKLSWFEQLKDIAEKIFGTNKLRFVPEYQFQKTH